MSEKNDDPTNITPDLTHAYVNAGRKVRAFVLVSVAEDGVHIFNGNPGNFTLIGAVTAIATALMQGGVNQLCRPMPEEEAK